MAQDPAFLFYPKDWLQGTAELLPNEKGVFIDLLCHQHQNGSLPTDINRLCRMVGLGLSEFLPIWEILKNKFIEENGRLINKKLFNLTEERSEKGHKNKIVGIFASLLRTSDLPKEDYIKIKKLFKVDEFLTIEDQLLTERLTEWFENALKTFGNGNEDGNGNINKDNIEKGEEKIHQMQIAIKELKNVSSLPIQIKFEECEKLLSKYSNHLIWDTLLAMENKADLKKKYKSVYLTLNNWLKNSKENGKITTIQQQSKFTTNERKAGVDNLAELSRKILSGTTGADNTTGS